MDYSIYLVSPFKQYVRQIENNLEVHMECFAGISDVTMCGTFNCSAFKPSSNKGLASL